MASAGISARQPELAMCRLVQETKGHKRSRFLGIACLTVFENMDFLDSVGKPRKAKYFLVWSDMRKGHLKAFENKKGRKSSDKVVAEFLGTEDRRCGKLNEDVVELNGVTYVALTKLEGRRGESSFLSRSLQAFNFVDGSPESALDELQYCLAISFSGDGTTIASSTGFSTRSFDLLRSVDDDSRIPTYSLRSEEEKCFLTEGEFEKDVKPFGAPPGGGYSPKIPIRVCAAQRGRDFGTPYLERGIHFRDVS